MVQSPWGEMPLRDAHVHFFSRKFFDILAAQKGGSVDEQAIAAGIELPGEPGELAQRWVGELDRHGVDAAVLIASVPGDEDSVAAAVQSFPSRFCGYFMSNPKAEDAGGRAEQAFKNGMRGICFFPAMHHFSMSDACVEPLVELAGQHQAVVFAHCGVLSVGIRGKLGLASRFDLRYSNPVDLHALAMRHPEVPFVIPHFGAGYFREALMVASLCPNIHFDTSSANGWMKFEGFDLATVFRRALVVLGADRLLFGSDSSFYPRGWVTAPYVAQSEALHKCGVSSDDARKIFGGNFSRLFHPG